MSLRSTVGKAAARGREWFGEHAATRVVCAACPSQRRCAFTGCDSRRGERLMSRMSAGPGVGSNSIWAAVKRAAGNLETWVKSQAIAGSKKIFLFNLSKQLDKVDEARGLAALYVQRVREASERLEGAAVAHRTDDRSVYHIQTACLVLASYRVLTEQLRIDQISSLNCILRCLGDSDSSGERLVAEAVKLSSRVMVTALRGDESSFLIRTARNMTELDFGESFQVTHDDSPSGHVAQVNRCFYHDFFSGHSAPQLTEIFCRADEAIFEKSTGYDLSELKDKGIFEVKGTLAAGHPACKFVIRKQQRRGGGEGEGGKEGA